MIIKKTEIVIYLDDTLPQELQLQSFSNKIVTKAAKKGSVKKSTTRKATGKKTNCELKTSLSTLSK
jgi:hypothetical protein